MIGNDNMSIWFTSDHHFGHKNIISYCDRPFNDIYEMEAVLIDNWNSIVQPSDTVYVVGDFYMGKNLTLNLPDIVSMLHGTKYLIAGNHDLCSPVHSKYEKYVEIYKAAGFDQIFISGTYMANGFTDINISHFPYSQVTGSDHSVKERFGSQRFKDNGDWLLCGHVHEKWQTNAKMINVGVDVWDYTPVNLHTLAKMMDDNPNGFPVYKGDT